jgi:hypothetical protein
VVAHIEPITNLLTIAINRKWLAGEGVVNDERNKLLRKMVWAVVVRAICREDWETVCVMVSTDKVVRGGFARGIRTIRFVGIGFLESGILRLEGTINFICRNM